MKIRFGACTMAAAVVICASSGVFSQSPDQSSDTYTITDLGTLGGHFSMARGVNVSGQVVGSAWLRGDAVWHAFVWQNGAMTDLGTLGGISSAASAINASGQVVGSAQTSSNAHHAFLWQDGTLTDLGTLGGSSSFANGINDSGQVVGSAQTLGNAQHAFLWQDGAITDLGTLGGSWSHANGINDSGEVVGSAQTAGNAQHAFLWQDGAITDLGTLGGISSAASAINASSQVVGYAQTPDAAGRAFLWQNGVMTDLGTPEGTDAQAEDINASGQVVGSAYIGDDAEYALLWHNGVRTDLNSLLPPGSGWFLKSANGINDSGQIVGWGYFNIAGLNDPANYQLRAFLLTPVTPTPLPDVPNDEGSGPVPPTVGFTVEADTFAGGGQGCWHGPFECGGAYYDETSGNWGDAQVRPGTDVDLWYDDGGIVIGGLDGLEWVTFPVTVPQSGHYKVMFRTASPVDRPSGSGVINVGIHGVDGSWVDNQVVPVTGGPGEWHTYVTWNAPRTIYLPAGPQTLTMWAAGGWYNLRHMTFTLEGSR